MLGRDEEIKKLEEFLRSEEESVAVVYGRKGMGKNALVSEVVASEKYLWFTGYPTTGDMEIRMMATVLQGRMEESLDIEKPEELFDAILAWADEEKATIVIDQYGAFAQAENALGDPVSPKEQQNGKAHQDQPNPRGHQHSKAPDDGDDAAHRQGQHHGVNRQDHRPDGHIYRKHHRRCRQQQGKPHRASQH